MSDLKILFGLITRNKGWAASALGTVISISAAVIAALIVFNNEYKPLPHRVDELEKKVSAIIVPSTEALQWVGTWQGKWDNTYDMRFQIFYTYGNNYLIEYNHREFPDQPMQNDGIAPGILDGNILTFRESITIRRTSATTATVSGVFGNSVGRRAVVTKQ
ncbi:hypothetical protein JQ633_02735 [Bradyrhizobium tropiciagri]|uniref:hypothetical protein n=1 Tax=Bradyrhizobium tropiciagri TaxID=312253 RepID=UPI001BABE0F7|nr:hypothetical protein [Bradyrhizobium tropiciagri]MBR0869260.1 hypothetical protein [Bradyrhizobium tropiciagri]